jgi:hypothetical protein
VIYPAAVLILTQQAMYQKAVQILTQQAVQEYEQNQYARQKRIGMLNYNTTLALF